MKAHLWLALCFFVSTAAAQQSPAAKPSSTIAAATVTKDQVATYQAGMLTGCKSAGANRGDDPDKVDKACKCVIKTLREHVAYADWQRAYLYSQAGDTREEVKILTPHMPKIGPCRDLAR